MSKNKFFPNSFQVPNSLVDKIMSTLTEFELKCYLMILRKTIGWNKDVDAISISQFQKNILVKDPRTIKNALNSLVKKELIFRKFVTGKSSLFSVNLQFNPLHNDVGSDLDVPPTSICNNPLHEDVPPPTTSTCTPQSNTNKTQNTNKKNIIKKSRSFTPPTVEEVENYIKEKGYCVEGNLFFEFYAANDWRDTNDKEVKNWKLKIIQWHKNSQFKSVTLPNKAQKKQDYTWDFQKAKKISDRLKDWLEFEKGINWLDDYYWKGRELPGIGWNKVMHPNFHKEEILLFGLKSIDENIMPVEIIEHNKLTLETIN